MGSRKESCPIAEAGLSLKESGKMVRVIKKGRAGGGRNKKLVWSGRRLQTLIASSDGKGEGGKQAAAFRKLGLMRPIRILKAKRCGFLKDLCPLLCLFRCGSLTCIKLIVANWLIES